MVTSAGVGQDVGVNVGVRVRVGVFVGVCVAVLVLVAVAVAIGASAIVEIGVGVSVGVGDGLGANAMKIFGVATRNTTTAKQADTRRCLFQVAQSSCRASLAEEVGASVPPQKLWAAPACDRFL